MALLPVIGPIVGNVLSGIGSVIGANKEAGAVRDANQANIDFQRLAAQEGLRWRVADARAAGINPLAALGFGGANVSSSVIPIQAGEKYRALGDMGQNIARAVSTTMTAKERVLSEMEQDVYMKELKLKGALIDGQMSKIGSPQGPSFPSLDGFGNPILGQDVGPRIAQTGQEKMQIIPTGRTASSFGNPSKAYGSITDYYFRSLPGGRLKIAPGPDVQGVLANNALEMLKWEWQHYIDQNLRPERYQPDYKEFPLPENKYWHFNGAQGTWEPRDWPSDWNSGGRKYYWGQKVYKKPWWSK